MKMGSNNPPNNVNNRDNRQLATVQSIAPSVANGADGQNTPRIQALPASSSAASSRGNASRVPVQPRQPRSLQGLLKFAMEATKAEDAPGNSEIGPMDEQRRQFLEEALKSLTVNVSEVLDNAIKVLTNTEKINNIREGQELPDDVLNAFTILLDYVDDIDVANDFFKMGGFAIFPISYGSKNEEVRALASSVLGTLCQNNPFCQKQALDCGLLHVLLSLVQTEQGNTLAKCLFAISCASREYEPACRELISQGGCDVLVQSLASKEPAARTKAAFLIRYLCQHYDDTKKQFVAQNIVKTIANQIQQSRDESTEHLLSILEVLVRSNDSNILRVCRDPKYNLKKALEDHLRRPELSDDSFREEKEYCHNLLTALFTHVNNVEAADR